MKRFLLPVAAVLCAAPLVLAQSLYDIPLKTIDGKDASLKDFKGKVLLIVNVASECGYTPQYEGLQKLHAQFKDEGLAVLGFPCNDFGGQEPGTPEQIKQFCSSNYQVTFPLFEKVTIKGPQKHPLYEQLTGRQSPFPGEVKWNFGKFLIGKDGKIAGRFDSAVEPGSAELVNAVKAALAAK